MPNSLKPLAFVLLLGLSACTSSAPPLGGVTATFVVPESLDALADAHFLDHPFPSDFRRDDAGKVRYSGFYNPRNNALLGEYAAYADGLNDGFSPVAAGYLRFNGALDPESLPASPLDALDPSASVQLLDVDPASPERGRRQLVSLSYRATDGQFVQANTLRFMPTFGFPLRPRTTYAIVVTTSANDAEGNPLHPSPHLEQVLGLSDATGPRASLAQRWASSIAELEAAGVSRSSIAHLAVFTTNAPADELFAVRDAVHATVPPPAFSSDTPWQTSVGSNYVEYRSSYGPSPNFQEGLLPFPSFGDGGSFHFVDGSPKVVDTFDARFSLTVPNCPMPASGYPIALHAHGTGGDYRSHLAFASELAKRCIASMGVDQIFHGTRPGAPPGNDPAQTQILFFNFENGEAARTNGRQSAIDEVQRVRLFTETMARIPAAVSTTGTEVRFDPDRVLFVGHSQGGLNGPLFLAADDGAVGGVLSGASGTLSVTLIEKTKPTPSVANLVRLVLLGLGPGDDEFDSFHPAIALAQFIIDPVDPVNYARALVREPRAGYAPKSLYMTEGIGPDGIGDSYAPPKGIESLAIALGLPLAEPVVHPITELTYGGPGQVTIGSAGLSGNLAGGLGTGALVQWAPAPGSDGHFVLYDIDAAQAQAFTFLRSLADGAPGTIPAP